MMYAVWGGFEIILIVCFIRNIPQSMENNVSIIVFQIALLIFIMSFNRNTNKKKIYEIIYNSPFSIGMCTGLNQLSEDEYGMLERKLKEVIGNSTNFNENNKIYISYVDRKIEIRYLFRSQDDYKKYIEGVKDISGNISEVEIHGRGVSMIYTGIL